MFMYNILIIMHDSKYMHTCTFLPLTDLQPGTKDEPCYHDTCTANVNSCHTQREGCLGQVTDRIW